MSRPAHTGSFSPELLEALLHGALKTFWVELPYTQAVKLRQRLYKLRTAMRLDNHEKYPLVSRVQVSIQIKATGQRIGGRVQAPAPEPCLVEIGPADTQFITALARAGIEPRHMDEPLEVTPVSEPPDALRAFFEDLKS